MDLREASEDIVAKELKEQEKLLINGTFVRWSEKARQAGLLCTTELKAIGPEGETGDTGHYRVEWALKKTTTTSVESTTKLEDEEFETCDDMLVLFTRDLSKSQDVWNIFRMLSRMSDQTVGPEEEKLANPWKEDAWKRHMGEMFAREWVPQPKRRKVEPAVKKDEDWSGLHPDVEAEAAANQAKEEAEEQKIQQELKGALEEARKVSVTE